MDDETKKLREQLIEMMRGSNVYRPHTELLQDITMDEASGQVTELPYTIWQLLEHLRFTQHDILDFCRNPNYKEPNWPDDYWPSETAPANQEALDTALQQFRKDLDKMIALVKDEKSDLYAPIPHGTGQTLLREAMLVATHNAYHIGEIVVLRRLLGYWKQV